jgi:hypothetical protein
MARSCHIVSKFPYSTLNQINELEYAVDQKPAASESKNSLSRTARSRSLLNLTVIHCALPSKLRISTRAHTLDAPHKF